MAVRSLMYVLWVVPIPILAFLAAMMIRRNLQRELPVFFWYTLVQISTFALQFVLFHSSYKWYFCVYWSTSLIGVVLGGAVIREIFVHLFRPYDALRDLGSVLFRWAAVVLVMVAIVIAASSAPSKISGLMLAILALERSVRVIQCGLVLFMLLFAAHLGITSKHHIFGISLGFGVFGAVELIAATLASVSRNTVPLNILKSSAYVAATVIWTRCLMLPEPKRFTESANSKTARWNFALGSVRTPEYNFLPTVESVVERVLTKRNIEVEHESK